MANYKHVEILSKGVTVWNRWRSQDPDIKPNLSGANFFKVDLGKANLRQVDLRKTDLRESKLSEADLSKADLRNANLRGACAASSNLNSANLSGAHIIKTDLCKADLQRADMWGARLDGSNMKNANLEATNLNAANLNSALLVSANLMHANLRGCNLKRAVLRRTNLTKADLSLADLTGARLYGSEREGWKIDGIKCEYVYWDKTGNQRSPAGSIYKPGEFEMLYRESPTIEYPFEESFSPVQVVLMDRAVTVINRRKPELELHLDGITFRGGARAIFSVLHPQDRSKALSLIHKHYQEQMQQTEAREVRQYIDKWVL